MSGALPRPKRFRMEYEEQVPALGYRWIVRKKAFSSPGNCEDEARYLSKVRGIRHMTIFELGKPGVRRFQDGGEVDTFHREGHP
jgi:hypothetical protein